MERSDAMIHAVVQRRKSALLASDWDIRQVANPSTGSGRASADTGLAREQADVLREAYDRIENFRDAVGFMFSAMFRGFAHLEKHYAESGLVTRLEPVEQWFWVRDGLFGAWEYNENALSGRKKGIPIDPLNFLVVETVALDRMLSVLYLRKSLSQKDWDSFLEVYGIPSVFLVGPPNTSAEKEEEYRLIAEKIISDGRGYLPNGSDIKFVNGGGTRVPFLEHVTYLDKQITLAATGGLLTMLAEAGAGTLAGNAHSETFMQIARGDAALLSGIFQEQFDAPLLHEFFPDQPVLAYFEFAPPASDEVSRVVKDAAMLAKAGVQVDPEELRERTGYAVDASAK
jgi:phage gp29-like protein